MMGPTSPRAEHGALLAIWHDVAPEYVDEYLRWHSFEHLPERLALPGFLRARRFERIEGPGQRFLCLIETDGLAAFSSPEYLARLAHPTEWTRRLMPRYDRVQRALCGVRFGIGDGVAPLVACVRFDPAKDNSDTAPIIGTLSALHTDMLVCQVQFGSVDQPLSARPSAESRLRGRESTGEFEGLIVLAGLEPASLREAVQQVQAVFAQIGCEHTSSHYRFSYAAFR